jgi:cyclopropane-fatty-acyl-phospholipid synthase
VTISQEQFNETQERISREGLSDLVTVKLQDYRQIEGHYDKLVSIEMIEAIGHQYLDTYFRKLNTLLKPNGKALIQAIVIDDNQYQNALKQVDYIKKYIFPGGFMPCYSVITDYASRNRLMLEDLHDMGLSYAQTLRDWRKRFYDKIDQVNEQGYDSGFQRMWEFYFCYCEGAFDERAISVGQILFRKQGDVV